MSEANFQIKTEVFEGPLDLLLSLIEKKKLFINDISLAKVADQFLDYLKNKSGISPDNLASFLVVAAKLVNEDDEIMLITTGGVLIRTRVKEIRELGRATQGVTLINLGEGEKLSGLEKIVETDEEDESAS